MYICIWHTKVETIFKLLLGLTLLDFCLFVFFDIPGHSGVSPGNALRNCFGDHMGLQGIETTVHPRLVCARQRPYCLRHHAGPCCWFLYLYVYMKIYK